MNLRRHGGRLPGREEVRSLLEELKLVHHRSSLSLSSDQLSSARDEDYLLAIRQFQQERGLEANGVVDADTYHELIGARYRLGDRLLSNQAPMLRGDDVRQLQQQLAELGFHHGNLDGIFGPTTGESLRAFQADYGLATDAVCGPLTRRALGNLLPKVTGGSPSALASQAYRHRTGPELTGRCIVLDQYRPGNPAARDFLNHLTEAVRDRLELLGANAVLAQCPHEDLTAYERSTRANELGAEIYLGLDVATHASPQAEGVASYYFGSPTGSSQVGRELAGLLQREIAARTGFTNLGEHPRVLETLRATRMPSIHLELGYLTNPRDRFRMADLRVRTSITDALVAGLQRFYLVSVEDHPTGTWQVPQLATE